MKTNQNEVRPVMAANVIWACGGIGGLYEHSTNYSHLTGDALAISLKHGVRLKNLNYVQIHPTTLYSEKAGKRFLISESVRGEGAVLYNREGKRFTDELLPRDLLTREIYRQMKKDKSPYVWLSMASMKDRDISRRFPNIYRKCLEEGFDPKKDLIPVVPSQHYFMGGVWVDLRSRTSMEHLYAVGEASCNGVHGANRLASNSLLESMVFARIAAGNISRERKHDFETETGWEQLKKNYGIQKEDYQNLEKYFKINSGQIKKEIENKQKKGEYDESDHDEIN